MSTVHEAVIVVGRLRQEFEDHSLLEHLIEDDDLQEWTAEPDGGGASYNAVGLEYERTGGQNAIEFDYDDVAIGQLADRFRALTGMDAKVYLSTYGF
jgi:hypothetical protein